MAILDTEDRPIMMSWEAPLMHEHAAELIHAVADDVAILNLGFGLGIFDRTIREAALEAGRTIRYLPTRTQEQQLICRKCKTGTSCTNYTARSHYTSYRNTFNYILQHELFSFFFFSGHTVVEAHLDIYAKAAASPLSQEAGVKVIHSKWQDALPAMLARGELFDIIFFDTWIERCDLPCLCALPLSEPLPDVAGSRWAATTIFAYSST
jgi:hypothetical protein